MTDHFKILFFIVGAGRSGTTILQSMLNAHPDITTPPESHFFRNYVVPEIRNQSDAESIQEIAETLKKDEFLPRFEIDFDELLRPFLKGSESFSYKNFYSLMLKIYAEKQGKIIVGEKDPSCALHLEEIYAAYPDTFILHIVRDPRDVVLSKSNTSWGRDRSFFLHLISTHDAFTSAREAGSRLFGRRYIEVLYEDLIKRPNDELERICRILGLTFHEDMISYYKNSSQIVSQDEINWKTNVFKPILENNTQKWVSGLPKWKIIFIEAVCKEAFTEIGYKMSGYGGNILRFFCRIPIFSYLLVRKLKRKLFRMLHF